MHYVLHAQELIGGGRLQHESVRARLVVLDIELRILSFDLERVLENRVCILVVVGFLPEHSFVDLEHSFLDNVDIVCLITLLEQVLPSQIRH